jgi:N-acetylmuramoyl-L-alanine amidase
LDLKKDASFTTFMLKKPERLVVDLRKIKDSIPQQLISVNNGIVKRVRAARYQKGVIRVVVDLEKPSHHKVFPLKKFGAKPPRLVIDIIRPDLEKADRKQREKTRMLKKKNNYIVVLDPGHGGEDPGAIGKRKTKEKDVVFSIAQKTKLLLNRQKGIQAYLTRKGDYFIPLDKRIEIAKDYGADLFLSIHADSSFSRKAHGSSVYCLSFKGASSNAARMLAQKENASDFMGGVSFDYKNNDLNAIIFDLVQTHSLNSSLKCAGLLLNEFGKINQLHNRKPQQAGFRVLRAPDITSVLVETDFISNPKKENTLKSTAFQNKVAKAITSGVARFLSESGATFQKKSPKFHIVKKGETLYSIAKRYNTTVYSLRKLNGLSVKSNLKTGTKLKVL